MSRAGFYLLVGCLVTTCFAAVAGATSIARVTLPEMERSASVVFVGRAAGVQPVQLGHSLAGMRYRFEVTRFLRGGPARIIYLRTPDLPSIPIGIEQGRSYLIFAERREFGESRESWLTIVGYPQGVYRTLSPQRAANEANGTVRIERLAHRLRK